MLRQSATAVGSGQRTINVGTGMKQVKEKSGAQENAPDLCIM
jgi:hypothetical protein